MKSSLKTRKNDNKSLIKLNYFKERTRKEKVEENKVKTQNETTLPSLILSNTQQHKSKSQSKSKQTLKKHIKNEKFNCNSKVNLEDLVIITDKSSNGRVKNLFNVNINRTILLNKGKKEEMKGKDNKSQVTYSSIYSNFNKSNEMTVNLPLFAYKDIETYKVFLKNKPKDYSRLADKKSNLDILANNLINSM